MPHEDAIKALDMLKFANRSELAKDQIADIELTYDETDEDRYDSDISGMFGDLEVKIDEENSHK